MDLEQLKIFITVVDSGSFTKAAELMYISHSTTSRNVSALEDALGTGLLDRGSRGLSLTPAGKLLYSEGKLLLEEAEELDNRIKSVGRGESGRLSIASASLYSGEMNEIYRDFCSRWPGVVMAVHNNELSEVHSLVAKGEVDLGVTFSYSMPKNRDDFELCDVAEEKFCVVCAETHPLAKRKSVVISELRKESYVGVGEQRSGFARRLEEEAFGEKPEQAAMSAPTLESLFLQVRNGCGISLVPYPMAREHGKNCSLLDVEDADTRFQIVVFWRKDNDNPSLPLFTGLLAEKSGKLEHGNT
ncbi:MAG: LysR family transcriptional regulator [Oscillospiraceae bacterium]|nr:LysR family transcriptional regulator [Oscillospiraceae bacterium]